MRLKKGESHHSGEVRGVLEGVLFSPFVNSMMGIPFLGFLYVSMSAIYKSR